ncbi:MAG: hypothetical protein DRH04_01925 [Deltaproteobacteria bacterium]|nr:MAG: hypothetical protein DRH04_01925 [Deltaproteobacteria bacterium]
MANEDKIYENAFTTTMMAVVGMIAKFREEPELWRRVLPPHDVTSALAWMIPLLTVFFDAFFGIIRNCVQGIKECRMTAGGDILLEFENRETTELFIKKTKSQFDDYLKKVNEKIIRIYMPWTYALSLEPGDAEQVAQGGSTEQQKIQ